MPLGGKKYLVGLRKTLILFVGIQPWTVPMTLDYSWCWQNVHTSMDPLLISI